MKTKLISLTVAAVVFTACNKKPNNDPQVQTPQEEKKEDATKPLPPSFEEAVVKKEDTVKKPEVKTPETTEETTEETTPVESGSEPTEPTEEEILAGINIDGYYSFCYKFGADYIIENWSLMADGTGSISTYRGADCNLADTYDSTISITHQLNAIEGVPALRLFHDNGVYIAEYRFTVSNYEATGFTASANSVRSYEVKKVDLTGRYKFDDGAGYTEIVSFGGDNQIFVKGDHPVQGSYSYKGTFNIKTANAGTENEYKYLALSVSGLPESVRVSFSGDRMSIVWDDAVGAVTYSKL
ncbi:hypothetical protein [Pseudobacteriovorax antillogorgiicola]|uniref:Lipoprotein n=1 Tax=Pseudobacteriovorax antillogorgiicola TaxID=1513793 RepID=A0A1Y6BEX7_9BACT|nr:hypothetical protein [Pseudobacteriovorax antillogorgiicola]TCS56292.1 hypothetical protein EDD56_104114 [Pseudobacteriovorax antillogorgiicola]SMF07496.1 hypothetical protein SAMN06296036_104219 [Pseudobacteriovorax antillogorgiicola]